LVRAADAAGWLPLPAPPGPEAAVAEAVAALGAARPGRPAFVVLALPAMDVARLDRALRPLFLLPARPRWTAVAGLHGDVAAPGLTDRRHRVALLVVPPAGQGPFGARVPWPVRVEDLGPTVALGAGLGVGPGWTGTDLLDGEARAALAARGGDPEALARPILLVDGADRAVRHGGWKRVERAGEGAALFDLRVDPAERTDRAGRAVEEAAGLEALGARLWAEAAEARPACGACREVPGEDCARACAGG
jgi:arylsulfatase A-like enzyme